MRLPHAARLGLFVLMLLPLPVLAQATDVPGLLRQLADPDAGVRTKAVQQLGTLRAKEAVEPLIGLLQDANPTVRGQAAAALGNIKDPRATAAIVPLLQDEFVLVRAEAVKALGMLGDRQATDALIAVVQANDSELRLPAIEALGKIRDPKAVPALLQIAGEPTSQRVPGGNAPEAPYAAFIAIHGMRDAVALDPLIAALHDPKDTIRIMAIRLLYDRRDPRVLAALINAWAESSADVRLCLLHAIAQYQDPRASALLVEETQDEDYYLRSSALYLLTRAGDERGIAPLLALFTDPNPGTRRQAIPMAEYRQPQVTEALAARLQDEDRGVRVAAALMLARRKDRRACETLAKAAELPEFRDMAIHALIMLQDPRGIDLLLNQLEEAQDEYAVSRVVDMLSAFGPQATASLIPILSNQDEKAVRRVVAMRVLNELQDPRGIDVLIGALRDQDVGVRTAALQRVVAGRERRYLSNIYQVVQGERPPIAFGMPGYAPHTWVGDPRAVQALLAIAQDSTIDSGIRADALSQLRAFSTRYARAAVPALLALVKSDTPQMRDRAYTVLAHTGDPQAQATLLAALHGTDPGVVSVAARALCGMCNVRDLSPLLREAQDQPDWKVRSTLIEAVAAARDARAVPALIDILRTNTETNGGNRERAALALGLIGDARAVEPLIATLQDPVEWVRSAAAWALGEIGDRRAIEPLATHLKTDDPRFIVRIAGALGRLGDTRGLEPLLPILQSHDEMARTLAVYALCDIRDPRALEPLLAELEQGEGRRWVQPRVYWALGESRDLRAAEAMNRTAQRMPSSYLDAVGFVGRLRLGGAMAWDPDSDSLRGPFAYFDAVHFAAYLKLGDARAWGEVATSLQPARLADIANNGHLQPALLALADAGDGRMNDLLAGAASHDDPITRVLAGRALVKLKDARGTAPLLAALQGESDWLTRDIAARTLCAVDDPATLGPINAPQLVDRLLVTLADGILEEQAEAARLLGVLRDGRALQPLIALLQDENPRLREAAAAGLGTLNQPDAAFALANALHDDASRVREQAAVALGRLKAKTGIDPLIAALQYEEATRVRDAIVTALQRTTGQTLGDDLPAWRDWWEGQRQ